jgi:hypothetical protein
MPTMWKIVIGCAIAASITFAVLYFTKSATAYSNEETWTWVDYKGNLRTLTVTRNAKVGQLPSKV